MKMKMNYQPAESLMPMSQPLCEGEATFLVKNIFNTRKDGSELVSKNGDPMISMMFVVRDKLGNEGTIYEYFTPKTLWKVHSLSAAVGHPEYYQPEVDYAHFVQLRGRCMLKLDKKPGFNARMVINSFLERDAVVPKERLVEDVAGNALVDLYAPQTNGPANKVADLIDDALPF